MMAQIVNLRQQRKYIENTITQKTKMFRMSRRKPNKLTTCLWTIFIFMNILFLGCESRNEFHVPEGGYIKKEYYNNGQLRQVQQLKDGAIEHGFSKFYYPNGMLEILTTFENGKREGHRIKYFENGIIELIEEYKNGMIEGEVKWYDIEGNLTQRLSCKKGLKYGNTWVYDPTSRVESYLFYGVEEEVIYRVDYNEFGQIIKEQGAGIPHIYLSSSENWILGDTMKLKIDVISPPHANQLKLKIGEFSSQGKLIRCWDSINVNTNVGIEYKHVVESTTLKRVGAILQVSSSDTSATNYFESSFSVTPH